MSAFAESEIESYSLEELQKQQYTYVPGPSLAPDEMEGFAVAETAAPYGEGQPGRRPNFEEVVLRDSLAQAIARLNPTLPTAAHEDALRAVLSVYSPQLIDTNEAFHRMLVEGVPVTLVKDGVERDERVWLLDFKNPENNIFFAVNQLTVEERHQKKRPDVLLYVNGLPLVLVELKNPSDSQATLRKAYDQIQTYMAAIPTLFYYNAFCVISDGLEAKAGTISSNFTRFMVWKSADGQVEPSTTSNQLGVLIQGMLNKRVLLDLIRNFIVFEKDKKTDPKTGLTQIQTTKKIAAYHQYYAVNKAVESTKRATGFAPSPQPSPIGRGGNYRGGFEFAGLVTEARKLRERQTPAEEIFWELARNRKFAGLKFRRQHQIGGYIVDFYCDEKKLVVEFDGGVHDRPDQAKHDSKRDQYLSSIGCSVLRFKNEEFLNDPQTVLEKIALHLSLWERPGEGYANRKAGVIWHTQGSGKSLSMVFYAGKLIHEMDNPTLLVITDRNDLDQQLFDTFAASKSLLGQAPVQAESREHLKSLLKVASGGIVFSTIQKFLPEGKAPAYDELSARRNIVVIADEAHRTQYGFEAHFVDTKDDSGAVTGKRTAYGFAKYIRDALPGASFIGFTGTPVEGTDVNTPQVFGNYIDIYHIRQAVDDGATVTIYYESRLAKVNLSEEGRKLVEEFDRETDEEEASDFARTKAKWTKLEAIAGNPARLKNLAQDIITHFEKRNEVFDGKAMIVAMSRRIAVALYDEIVRLRPQWHSEDLNKGVIKVVMTSASSDKLEFDPEDPAGLVIPAWHRTTKEQRKALAERLKEPKNPLKLVIVRDMWLTGFDVPCLDTLYIDKPMKGHTLMQAIARVNRVYLDKEGGLIVDYIGIGTALKEAMKFYAEAGGKGTPADTQAKAVEALREKIEVVRQMFHGMDYMRFFKVGVSERLSLILKAEEFILGLPDGKNRFIRESTALSRLFALAVPHEEALKLSDEIAFFQAVRARFLKFEPGDGGGRQSYETAIRQIINQAVQSAEVVDVFDAAGLKKPEISLLSEEFLLDVKKMEHRHLALELLKRILNDEIQARLKFNVVEGRRLLEMLETSIKKYQNNLLSTAEIIEELVAIARQIRTVDGLAEKLKLSKDEFAFYTALEVNDSAVKGLGDEVLLNLAREIADKVRSNATIDWAMKESARAKLMVIVRRTLNKYGYPPDKQEKAVETVLKQAEVLADHWAG